MEKRWRPGLIHGVPVTIACVFFLVNTGIGCPRITGTPHLFIASNRVEVVEKTATRFPKIYLSQKITPAGIIASSMYSFPGVSYSFSYSPHGPFAGIGIFGYRLAREIKIVPQAASAMKTYFWTGTASAGLFVGGICVMVGSFILDAKHSHPDESGTYDVRVPAGIPIGLLLAGAGAVTYIIRPFFLHSAVNAYNRRAYGI